MLRQWGFLAVVLLLLSRCAVAEEAPAYAGSCVLDNMCIETSADFTAAQAQSNCSKIKGTYSPEHCPKVNVIGSCQEKTKSAKAYTTYYYSQGEDSDPEEIALDCKFRTGIWNPNDSSVALNE